MIISVQPDDVVNIVLRIITVDDPSLAEEKQKKRKCSQNDPAPWSFSYQIKSKRSHEKIFLFLSNEMIFFTRR